MLKQILAASALIAIGAVSIQFAGAAEASKFRQLVVEPAGTPASAESKKTEVAPLVVEPAQGIPSPTKTADLGADADTPTGAKALPLIAQKSEGIPAATDKADAGAPAAADLQPLPLDQAQPAADATPVDPSRIVTGIQSQKGLYLLLTGRGYGVEILKRAADGNVVFSVTVPSRPGEAFLLLVDKYGKVIERRHIDTAPAYSKTATHTPRYTPTYAATDDNCDDSAGY